MKPYLSNLKHKIEELATQGRALRHQASETSHQARHQLKAEARELGRQTRAHLLAYHILRGRHPALSESPHTRWDELGFLRTSRVVALVELFYEGAEIERVSTLERAKAEVDAWRAAVAEGRGPQLHDGLRQARADARTKRVA
ncbi:MAG: hypothetical protein ACE366_03835 [Bradymonadia bacterium]